MSSIRRTAVAALASTALLAAPGAALAHDDGPGHGHGHGPADAPRSQHDKRKTSRHAVPPRIAAKLRAAERAALRAQRQEAKGHHVAATQALIAARRHLTSARKPIRSLRGDGAATAAAFATTYGRVAAICVGLLAGAPDPVVAADAATLKVALDARDSLVAGIAALPDRASYGAALTTIAKDATGEAAAIATLLSGPGLTDAAKAALTAAQAQVTATAAAAQQAGGATAAV